MYLFVNNKIQRSIQFFLNVEYEHIEAIALFFNDLAADLKRHRKLE
jgi:hypothetical protein